MNSQLVEVYIRHTREYVWLPAKLAEDKSFMDKFANRAVSHTTVLAFSKVNRMGYAAIPMQHYLPGLENFLIKLQRGERTIANLYCGQCPHRECRRFVTNQDSGHFCLAMNGKFTDHHIGRAALGLPK